MAKHSSQETNPAKYWQMRHEELYDEFRAMKRRAWDAEQRVKDLEAIATAERCTHCAGTGKVAP